MHAALITGRETVELREFPDPTPAPAGVVVDIAYCGICGTDVHAYQSGHPYNPAICGHEWAGTVSAVGSEVSSVGEGDRVVVAAAPSCGACAACRAGQAERCQVAFMSAIGRDSLTPPHGGFAPRLAVAASRVVKTDPGLSDEQAAQVEPTTVAFHAVRTSGLRLGDIAVVQGAGPIGLGADIVYECVGLPFAVQSAVDLARRGGAMCLIGLADEDASITPATWLIKEIRLTAALAYFHEEFEMAMGMMADGRVVVDPLHTATVGLDGFEPAIADLATGQSPEIKILVDPTL